MCTTTSTFSFNFQYFSPENPRRNNLYPLMCIPLYEMQSCWVLILEIHQHHMQNQPLTLMDNPHASVTSKKFQQVHKYKRKKSKPWIDWCSNVNQLQCFVSHWFQIKLTTYSTHCLIIFYHMVYSSNPKTLCK